MCSPLVWPHSYKHHSSKNPPSCGILGEVLGCVVGFISPSKTSIMERINKPRSAFFSRGELGAFHGLLNPLSSHSLIECCIIPVLMYVSESWVLNSTLLSKLESFQAELGKRMLKLPKHTSNTIPLLVLNWP